MTYFAPKGTGCLSVAPQIKGAERGIFAARGTGCLPGEPKVRAEDPEGTRYLHPPHQERVRHLLYGSLAGIDRTIKILHTLGYADPNDWSEPIPTGKPNQWMVIMTKILVME